MKKKTQTPNLRRATLMNFSKGDLLSAKNILTRVSRRIGEACTVTELDGEEARLMALPTIIQIENSYTLLTNAIDLLDHLHEKLMDISDKKTQKNGYKDTQAYGTCGKCGGQTHKLKAVDGNRIDLEFDIYFCEGCGRSIKIDKLKMYLENTARG